MAFYRASMGGGGSATSITPSNSSPVALTANTPVNPTTAGYAIESYSSKTPSSSPSSVSSGDIVKMGGSGYLINSYSSSSISPGSSGTYFGSGWNYMNSSGYAYSSRPSGGGATSISYQTRLSPTSTTISFSATSGGVYLVLALMVSTSSQSYTRMDGCTASGGSITKLVNLLTSNQTSTGTFYKVIASSSTVTITLPVRCTTVLVFRAT